MNSVDLFSLGQSYLHQYRQELALYGIEVDPGLELRQGSGVLCYYSLEDGHIYLTTPNFGSPIGKLQALYLRSLLGSPSDQALLELFRLLIPHIIAHELAHHLRHRYGTFSDSMWQEEQIANKLAAALVKHRLSPSEKQQARQFLKQAIDTLAASVGEATIAVDSYHSVLHALNISGQVGISDFESIELLQRALDVSPEEVLLSSGHLSGAMLRRLEQRPDLIEAIDTEYASNQVRYIYYHVGWLYLDLNSRETEYVDEFARTYLNLKPQLLPPITLEADPSPQTVQACFKASQLCQPLSKTASRFFYKRYRSLLLAKLKAIKGDSIQIDRLKREVALVLEDWTGESVDTLAYLGQLVPPALQPLLPHTIAERLDPYLCLPADLPAETDRRIWQTVTGVSKETATVNTLNRLALLDQTDIYRGLPAEVMLALVERFWLVHYAPGEAVIWQNEYNDDVYILLDGKLEVQVTQDGQPAYVGEINPGEIFGEIAFFTEDPRYATVRAIEPARCFVMTNGDLQLIAF
ncbi:MAG TPA: cyclic nucleotide-binding domain-containing protein, partial [Anaerolineae bacterium]|nr:cyclic nucleotide-binding domain-containing protein [Anaerolineae bacterium]